LIATTGGLPACDVVEVIPESLTVALELEAVSFVPSMLMTCLTNSSWP
jgi:hypothetical protein